MTDQEAVEQHLIRKGWDPIDARMMSRRPNTLTYAAALLNARVWELGQAVLRTFRPTPRV